MQTRQEVLKACTIKGFTVILPPVQLERKLYMEVAKSLELIGGVWSRKEKGFIFNEDPAKYLSQVQNGEKKNLKKEFQFFGTPDSLADEMAALLGIEEYDLVLEPSAGQGALIKAVQRKYPNQLVHYCELMELNRTFLEQIPQTQYITNDFLKLKFSKVTTGTFDKIIANPPFSKNQDISHIKQMWDCLKPGGRIVTIASNHWKYASGKKETEFKKWVYDTDSDIHEIEAGAFAESGTKIATCMLVIDKPI